MFDIRKTDESRQKKILCNLRAKQSGAQKDCFFLFKKAMHISNQKAGMENEENLSYIICSSSILYTCPLHLCSFSAVMKGGSNIFVPWEIGITLLQIRRRRL